MAVSTSTILYDKRDHVAYITLNRPDVLNALNQELRDGLRQALLDFRDDPDLLVAIMTGAGGRAFSAGAPLSAQVHASEDAIEGPRAFAEKRTPAWKVR